MSCWLYASLLPVLNTCDLLSDSTSVEQQLHISQVKDTEPIRVALCLVSTVMASHSDNKCKLSSVYIRAPSLSSSAADSLDSVFLLCLTPLLVIVKVPE